MKLTLDRFLETAQYTLGILSVDGEPFCFTLEDPVRAAKIPKVTAIPAGLYGVTVEPSPRFGIDLPRLHHVPDFSGVLIHGGNRPEDTDGCILVGFAVEFGHIIDGTSRPAIRSLTKILQAAGAATIEIA